MSERTLNAFAKLEEGFEVVTELTANGLGNLLDEALSESKTDLQLTTAERQSINDLGFKLDGFLTRSKNTIFGIAKTIIEIGDVLASNLAAELKTASIMEAIKNNPLTKDTDLSELDKALRALFDASKK